MKERTRARDARRAHVVQREAACQRRWLGRARHREQPCIQGGPGMAPYPWEEGVEQTSCEPSAHKAVAGTSLLMFLKCLGDEHYRKNQEERGTHLSSVPSLDAAQ